MPGEATELHLHEPPKIKQKLEAIGIWKVNARDITSSKEDAEELLKRYPDLMGDTSSLEPSEPGMNQRGWWKDIVHPKTSQTQDTSVPKVFKESK